MAWNSNQLTQALNAFAASQAKAEILARLTADNSNTAKVFVPFSVLALACEKEIDEEAKVLQLVNGIKTATGWKVDIHFLTGSAEFYE